MQCIVCACASVRALCLCFCDLVYFGPPAERRHRLDVTSLREEVEGNHLIPEGGGVNKRTTKGGPRAPPDTGGDLG